VRCFLAIAPILVLLTAACGGGERESASITIRHSHFSKSDLTARAGEPITITLENDDPIEHEWIVGAEEVHERHRTGTEPHHDSVPTEVTIRPYETRTTTVTFDQPGDYPFICHLPGHEAYGMRGTLHVRPR
jgi:uncharacterized cupredoxin-like copper-binding protein